MLNAAQLAGQKAEWERQVQGLNGLLTLHSAVFEAVRVQVLPLWEALLQGKTFARKPSYGLRLLGAMGRRW